MSSEQVNEAQLMEQVSSMRSQEVMQEFFTTVRDKCFDKCVTKPSSSLSSSEQQCLARCCDRYAEVRAQKESYQPTGRSGAAAGHCCAQLAA